eukprot:4081472-Amphidinium_carterae.2
MDARPLGRVQVASMTNCYRHAQSCAVACHALIPTRAGATLFATCQGNTLITWLKVTNCRKGF